MAADIFGAGLDRKVDAFVEGTEIERARPGIVHEHHRALGVGGCRDRRHVLDLERQRARRLHEHRAGVRLHQRGNAGADQRVIIGGGDAVAREHAVAEFPRRLIDAVGNEHVIAGVEHRQQRGRDRRESGGQERNAGAIGAFELAQRIRKRLRRGGAPPPVEIAGAAGEKILRRWIEHRRGVIDRRIDEAVIGGRVATAHHQARRRLELRVRGVGFGLFCHGLVPAPREPARPSLAKVGDNRLARKGHGVRRCKRQPLDPDARSF